MISNPTEPNGTLKFSAQLTLKILFEEDDLTSSQVKPCLKIYHCRKAENLWNKKNVRKLKVYSKYQRRNRSYVKVPEIRLTGKWLKRLHFETGKEIVVVCENNKLIISPFDWI